MTFKEWLKDVQDINDKDGEESALAYVIESLRDKKRLHWFGRYYFQHIIKGEQPVPESHRGLLKELNRREDGAIIFPRGFAKSTWVKIDTIHDIVYATEPVILYVSNTFEDAAKHFESIKSELENNELLRYVYGDLVPPESNIGRKWTNKHFETTNGVNVVAKGAGKGRGVNIKNQRPTKIIIDDGEDDDMVASNDRREKFERWVYNVVMPSKDPQCGYVKMIGTVLSPHCQVLKFYKKHGGIFRKAIENNKSIWPWMWSVEKLMAKKEEIGSRAFAQEYLNTPIISETALIKPEWIKFYSTRSDKKTMYVSIMLDPQSGESKDADFYGLSVVGKYKNDSYKHIMEVRSGKSSKLKQAALFVQTYQRYKKMQSIQILNAGIEVVMTQVAVYQLVLDWKAGRIDLEGVDNNDRNIKVIKINPEGRKKTDRLEEHEADFERGEILFHESLRSFADKLTCFPEVEHDDDIDSTIYALSYVSKHHFVKTAESGYNSSTIVGNVFNKRF